MAKTIYTPYVKPPPHYLIKKGMDYYRRIQLVPWKYKIDLSNYKNKK